MVIAIAPINQDAGSLWVHARTIVYCRLSAIGSPIIATLGERIIHNEVIAG